MTTKPIVKDEKSNGKTKRVAIAMQGGGSHGAFSWGVMDRLLEDGRFEIEMDWNDAFIKYLRQHGFRGANEEILVQQWLASIHKEIEQGGDFQ